MATLTEKKINKAYENLANAIIVQAVEDYRRMLRGRFNFDKAGQSVTFEDTEDFFKSKWFYTLTNVDGKTLLNRLRREYENECISNTKHP